MMDSEQRYEIKIQVTHESLLVLQSAVRQAARYWPGGNPGEQRILEQLSTTLNAAALDVNFRNS